jgi:hypothetical protein
MTFGLLRCRQLIIVWVPSHNSWFLKDSLGVVEFIKLLNIARSNADKSSSIYAYKLNCMLTLYMPTYVCSLVSVGGYDSTGTIWRSNTVHDGRSDSNASEIVNTQAYSQLGYIANHSGCGYCYLQPSCFYQL